MVCLVVKYTGTEIGVLGLKLQPAIYLLSFLTSPSSNSHQNRPMEIIVPLSLCCFED